MSVAETTQQLRPSGGTRGAQLDGLFVRVELVHLALFVAMFGVVFYVMPEALDITPRHALLALLSTVPALVTLRPWERLPRPVLALGTAVSAAALVTLCVTPAGWTDSQYAGFTAYATSAFFVTASYASTPARRRQVAVFLGATAMYELQFGLREWVAAGNPDGMMYGTLGWHNQFAAFLLAPGLLALAMYVLAPPSRLTAAWGVVSTGCGVGVIFATSRACVGLFALGWLAVGICIVRTERRVTAVLRWLSMPVLCFVAVHALTSVFFDARTYTSPMTSSGGPRGTATLGGNGEFRKVYIDAGLQSFLAHPVVGTGFGSFRAAAAGYLPAGFGPIYGVYDIWVDALMSGGLLYGLPLVAASLATFAMLVRVGWRAVRSVSAETPMTVGAVVAAAALAGHFAFDLDSYYLQLMGLLGMLLGLAYSLRLPRAEP